MINDFVDIVSDRFSLIENIIVNKSNNFICLYIGKRFTGWGDLAPIKINIYLFEDIDIYNIDSNNWFRMQYNEFSDIDEFVGILLFKALYAI